MNDSNSEISKNILLMDDDFSVTDAIKNLLQIVGHKCDVAETGEEALEKYKASMDNNEKYDLVIMDLTIPNGMGGKEAVLEILKIDADAVCVVSSGHSEDEIMISFSDFGFKGAIAKPFRFEVLKKLVSELT